MVVVVVIYSITFIRTWDSCGCVFAWRAWVYVTAPHGPKFSSNRGLDCMRHRVRRARMGKVLAVVPGDQLVRPWLPQRCKGRSAPTWRGLPRGCRSLFRQVREELEVHCEKFKFYIYLGASMNHNFYFFTF